tara:strand:- start:13923 stop:14762 length:840 start_codon:yes stop_codon:yes gene_type:complete
MRLVNNLKTVLITGGTRGVGLELAKMFKKQNYNVIITGRDSNYSKKIAKKLNNINTNGIVKGYKLDFLDINGSSKLLNKLQDKTIQPTILINNAGVLMLDNINNITDKRLDTMFKVNTYGPILLSKLCKDHIWKTREGGILFNSPPYQIDNKTTHLMPYMQSKLAQTTFMKSLANSIPQSIPTDKHNIIVASFWTNYPLLTDAIIKRGIGKEEDCMHPAILSDTIKELLFNTKNVSSYNGKEIIDEDFLNKRKIDITKYKMSKNVSKLDKLFMNHLIKK